MYQIYSFAELTPALLYSILRLRSKIFVLEQEIAYLDMDGNDQQCLHVCQFDSGELIAYARIVPPGVKFEEASIGRIVVEQAWRSKGVGRGLILHCAQETWRRYGECRIVIEEQSHLQAYYKSLGFVALSEPYMLEGLMHVKMAMEPPVARKLHAAKK